MFHPTPFRPIGLNWYHRVRLRLKACLPRTGALRANVNALDHFLPSYYQVLPRTHHVVYSVWWRHTTTFRATIYVGGRAALLSKIGLAIPTDIAMRQRPWLPLTASASRNSRETIENRYFNEAVQPRSF